MTDRPLSIGIEFVLDELFDLTLYQRLHDAAPGDMRPVLAELIPVETRHLQFWKTFFKIERAELDFRRRLKLSVLIGFCRLVGPVGIHMTLEAIEIYGIRKYLSVWERYKNTELGDAVRGILKDEFDHEDEIVSRAGARRIDPRRVSNIFLGFNDGLVEILGAVSGFFAALGDTRLVLMAGVSVAAAGAFSMGAGAYAAASSASEVERLDVGKKAFLGQGDAVFVDGHAWSTGLLVALSYLVGAVVPLLPVALGARTLLWPALLGGVMSLFVSLVLSFLSGMESKKRMALNAFTVACALAWSFAVGYAARRLWGISV